MNSESSPLLNRSSFKNVLSPRKADANKGSYGCVLIVGGDTGMVGAVLLAARAALVCGSGKVFASSVVNLLPSVDIEYPELMLRPIEAISELFPSLSCIVIGCGLGQSTNAIKHLECCLQQNITLLLDADALNLIAKNAWLADLVKHRSAATIMTPHPGEAARLLSISISEVNNNRVQSAQLLAKAFHASCVLKGAGSICAHFDGTYFVNTSGNPSLASAGTGDVLSGIVGGLLAQGLAPFEALKMGVLVHGLSADTLVSKFDGMIGIRASEVLLEVRNTINQLVKQ